jgi:hypothetical protein
MQTTSLRLQLIDPDHHNPNNTTHQIKVTQEKVGFEALRKHSCSNVGHIVMALKLTGYTVARQYNTTVTVTVTWQYNTTVTVTVTWQYNTTVNSACLDPHQIEETQAGVGFEGLCKRRCSQVRYIVVALKHKGYMVCT